MRQFVREKVAPLAAETDRDSAVPAAQLETPRALELDYAFLDEPIGAGLSFTHYLAVLQEIAAGDGPALQPYPLITPCTDLHAMGSDGRRRM